MLGYLHALLSSADFFQDRHFKKNSFRGIIRMSYIYDPLSQGHHFVGLTVCKDYQQTTLVGKDLKVNAI